MSTNTETDQIITTIQDGLFWRIIQAESVTSGEQLWFKLLTEKYAAESDIVAMFHESASVSKTLQYDNIIPTLDHGQENSKHFWVMNPFKGVPLVDHLMNVHCIEEKKAVNIILQVCGALQHAHLSGVYHGGLTPDSIFINQKNHISIINFGCAPILNLLVQRRDKNALYVAAYLSPERLRDSGTVNSRTELYSVGAIFYQLLTGYLPFKGENLGDIQDTKERVFPSPREYNKEISPHIDKCVMKLLAKQPGDRYPNFVSFIQDLTYNTGDVEPDNNIPIHETGFIDPNAGIRGFSHKWAPTWVGNKRRLASVFMIILMVFIIAASVIFLSDIDIYQTSQVLSSQDNVKSEEINSADNIDKIKDNSDKNINPIKDSLNKNEKGQKNLNAIRNSASKPKADRIVTATKLPVESVKSNAQKMGSDAGLFKNYRASIEQPISLMEDIPGNPIREKTNATLIVNTFIDSLPVSALVYLNDKFAGNTNGMDPHYITGLKANESYSVRIQKAGFKIWEQKFTVSENDSLHIHAILETKADALRRFRFAKVSFADKIILDNRLPSQFLPYSVDLPIGIHTVTYIDSKNDFTWNTHISLDMNSDKDIFFYAEQVGFGILDIGIPPDLLANGSVRVKVDGLELARQNLSSQLRLAVGWHRIIVERKNYRSIPDGKIVHIPANGKKYIDFQFIPLE